MLVNRSGLLKDNEQSYRDKAIKYPNETNGKQTSQNKRSEGEKMRSQHDSNNAV